MYFMNEYEIRIAVERHRHHPVLQPATEILYGLMEVANQNSDGWCYWPKPCRSAAQLMTLIHDTPHAATPEALKKALRPVKAFLTRYHFTLDMKGY